MSGNVRAAYPTFPASCWWPLRERFKRALPQAVTAAYLQAILEVEPKTARNLVPMLRQMGLIDDSGAPLERANAWRVDADYADVCRAIRSEIYPEALLSAAPEPNDDFDAAVRWFMKSSGVGTAAAKRMARFYALLSKAEAGGFDVRGQRSTREPSTPRSLPGRNGTASGPGRAAQNGRAPYSSSAPPARSSSSPAGASPQSGAAGSPSSNDSTTPVSTSSGSKSTPAAMDGALSERGRSETGIGSEEPVGGREASSGGGFEIRPVQPGLPGEAAPTTSTSPQLVVQIVLPPNATAEQIDQLVASVARHFFAR